ncbi:MAG: leucine-rich repeat domain-containing protein [Lachnospiraceae bacterium]|nr:leucine-rich repeat domain-containing protein [Lachnospiraceae bacterium]MBQ6545190.1 leucine-rich repeat domain-containing protein [Lachnospiraceae bacterium]
MQNFIFKMAEDETYCAVSYTGDEAEVVIPETYQERPVTILLDGLFAGHEEITSVSIPDTVTDIGGFVFDGCVNLRHIKLPESLTALWSYAFVRSGIEEIKLPRGVRTIPPFTFQDCANLRKVECNYGLTNIYGWAFGGCDMLTELYYGPNTKLSPLAFEKKEMKA